MRWLLTGLAAFALMAPSLRAADNDPTVYFRLASIDNILSKAKYIGGLVAQGDTVEQLLGIVEAMNDPKNGLEGIDTSRPFGFTASLENLSPDNPTLIMIPIKNEKSFIGLLDRFGVSVGPKPDKDGIYTITGANVPLPLKMLMTQKYAMLSTQGDVLDVKKLPNVEKLLADKDESLLTFTIRFDRIPAEIRDVAISQIENRLADEKEAPYEGESPAVKKMRLQYFDYTARTIKSMMNEGRELKMGLIIDEKADDLGFSFSMSAMPKTALAQSIANMGKSESMVLSGVEGKQLLGRFGLNIALPEELKKLLGPIVDETIQKAVDDVPDAAAAPFVERLLAPLKPTLKAGLLDMGIGVHGPSADGKYTVMLGLKVQDGETIAKALKEVVGDIPDNNVQEAFAFDVEKVSGLTLHEVKVGSHVQPEQAAIFGQSSLWLGTSKDRVFAAFGPDAKDLLQTAAKSKKSAQPTMISEVSMGKILPLFTPEKAEESKQAIKKVFGGSPSGKDTISLKLEGGERASLQFRVKGALLRYSAAMAMPMDE